MDKISVKVLRDLANNPSIVEIMKNNRKIKATFDPTTGLVLEGPSGSLPSVAEILQMAYPYEMPSFSRPAWYDRNPESKVNAYDSDQVPHAETPKIEYTVPDDKIAYVEMLYCLVCRAGAAGTAGDVRAMWRVTPKGGNKRTVLEAYLRAADNLVGDRDRVFLGATMPLYVDDKLELSTLDVSIGGAVRYRGAYKLTEFDA